MSIKWAIGAIVAVMAAMVMLPGIAGAEPGDRDDPIEVIPQHDKNASISGFADCRDEFGDFSAHFTLEIDAHQGAIFAGLDDPTQSYAVGGDTGVDLLGNPTTSGYATNLFIEGDTYVDEDGDPIDGNGVYQDSQDYGIGDVNDILAQTSVVWLAFQDEYYARDISTTVGSPTYCIETGCVSGDFTEQPVNDFTDNDSCETLLRCDEGQSLTVTQHELDTVADLADSTAGDCPTNEPITPVVLVVEPEPEPEPEAEVEGAVVEVAAALPAAGYGDSAGASFAWTALAAVALLSIGGSVAVVARRK
jgi:hypothetical protein